MLTKVIIRNFKRFEEVEVELGNPVVFIGPNNSGKTSALQALALWDAGLRSWLEKRQRGSTAKQRPGVTINRRDLAGLPLSQANLIWRNLHTRETEGVGERRKTKNVNVDIVVEGVTDGSEWRCGLEFDYANPESFYCRPLRLSGEGKRERMEIPSRAASFATAFLPPMSGLASEEPRLDPGRVRTLLGEGRSAEVLRNLCYQTRTGPDGEKQWNALVERIENLFGVRLGEPVYVSERGIITMDYRDVLDDKGPNPRLGPPLDLSAAGRGLHQTLLLLAFLTANPGHVLLLDEPDAHLEILRQRQVYQILTETARQHKSQIIIASHSEVILNEAADRDVVVAFLGQPHRIDDRGTQLLKSLKAIGFDHYYQAKQRGWVLYLEGATDLAILRSFAEKMEHAKATRLLQRPFVHYVENQPVRAQDHFRGLREAKPDLVAFALFDRLGRKLPEGFDLPHHQWKRREIENYLCQPETLRAFAVASAERDAAGPLYEPAEGQCRREVMDKCIEALVPKIALEDPSDRWWRDTKASDDFLDRLFVLFYKKLSLPNAMLKSDYHLLAPFVRAELLDPEIAQVLDRLCETAHRANPAEEP